MLGANVLGSFELNDDGFEGEAALGGDFVDDFVHVSVLTEVECGEVGEGSHKGGCGCRGGAVDAVHPEAGEVGEGLEGSHAGIRDLQGWRMGDGGWQERVDGVCLDRSCLCSGSGSGLERVGKNFSASWRYRSGWTTGVHSGVGEKVVFTPECVRGPGPPGVSDAGEFPGRRRQ